MRKAVPFLVILVLLVAAGYGVSQAQASAQNRFKQPLEFPHNIHTNVVGIECTFCHRNVDKGAAATVPSVEQCLFCHKVPGLGAGLNFQVLQAAWNTKTPINWIRVHRLPDHVQFIHEPHIRAGFDCATCHGDVKSMVQVQQVRDLKMGDCVNCHRQNNAPTDCAICHY